MRRSWIRYHLSQVINPATGKGFLLGDISEEVDSCVSTVSRVLAGERSNKSPRLADRIRRIAARILGLSTDELFGVWLDAGDGYAGSPGKNPRA